MSGRSSPHEELWHQVAVGQNAKLIENLDQLTQMMCSELGLPVFAEKTLAELCTSSVMLALSVWWHEGADMTDKERIEHTKQRFESQRDKITLLVWRFVERLKDIAEGTHDLQSPGILGPPRGE